MELRTLALGNLIAQFIFIGLVIYSGYTVKSRRLLKKHCSLMRIAVVLLIATTVIVMLPSLLGYAKPGVPFSWVYVELWVHHGTGLVVLAVFVYANLAYTGIIKTKHRLIIPMRIAAVAWLAAFVMGVHLYLVIWT